MTGVVALVQQGLDDDDELGGVVLQVMTEVWMKTMTVENLGGEADEI